MVDFTSLLKENNLKVTPQRLAILEEIEGSGHISVDEVYAKIKAKYPSISLATVYKNLTGMEECGILNEVKIPNNKHKYEIIKKPHAHLICSNCGEVKDMSFDYDPLITTAASQSGYDVANATLSFLGRCPGCR